jgi:peptidoglycan/LPS O-acetylase OafA/YrhL
MARGAFTFLGFYKRRAIRIFPAFMVMVVVTTAAGLVFMIRPISAVNADSAVYSVLFLSNIFFWRNTDYFSPASHIYMYLHTWSLAVEEQFYIFYPMILVLLNRFAKASLGSVIVAAVIGSFIISLLFYHHASGWAFFLLPSRAWQLGLGAMIALNKFPEIKNAGTRAGLAVAGLAMIFASFVILDESWPIPAPWALPASLGAALLIAYGDKAPTSNLLSLPPVAWIGTISYSLYLWHWPIIVLYRTTVDPAPSIWQIAALIALTVGAGAASYYAIEKPLMQRLRQRSAKRIVFTSGALIAGLATALASVRVVPDDWSTFPPEARRIASFYNYAMTPLARAQSRLNICFSDLGPLRYDSDTCTRQLEVRPTLALVGDSHAAQYYLALRERFPNHNIIQVTGAGCFLLLDVKGDERCNTLNRLFFERLVAQRKIDRVIFAHRWETKNVQPLGRTIEFLHKRNVPVTVIGPVEQFKDSFPVLLATAIKRNAPQGIEQFRLPEPSKTDQLLASAVVGWGADYYSVRSVECPKRACRYLAPDGVPIHYDYGHVTQSGAAFLLSRFPRY